MNAYYPDALAAWEDSEHCRTLYNYNEAGVRVCNVAQCGRVPDCRGLCSRCWQRGYHAERKKRLRAQTEACLAELGWTAADLARRMERKTATIQNWIERGPRVWVVDYLRLLVDERRRGVVREPRLIPTRMGGTSRREVRLPGDGLKSTQKAMS